MGSTERLAAAFKEVVEDAVGQQAADLKVEFQQMLDQQHQRFEATVEGAVARALATQDKT